MDDIAGILAVLNNMKDSIASLTESVSMLNDRVVDLESRVAD